MYTDLKSEKNRMSLRSKTHRRRSLLHGFKCILDLMEATLWREDSVIRVVCVPKLGNPSIRDQGRRRPCTYHDGDRRSELILSFTRSFVGDAFKPASDIGSECPYQGHHRG